MRRCLAWLRGNPDAGVAVALTLLYVLARVLSPYPAIDGDGSPSGGRTGGCGR